MTKRVAWACCDCGGLFTYPDDADPNFCPYCGSARLRPRACDISNVVNLEVARKRKQDADR
jgi:DNA-directed RNA polymerase subunit RPC12/RpoP